MDNVTGMLILFGSVVFFCVFLKLCFWWDNSERGRRMKAERREEWEWVQDRWEQQRRNHRLSITPIRTKLVDASQTVTSQVSTSSAIGRAIVGDVVAGPIGAVIGAGTARHKYKEHRHTTFLVYYADGTRKVETVENGTTVYKRYIELLDTSEK